jgi:phytoene desaturase
MSKIIVIGSGFSGLSAATTLASFGYDVHIYEKNEDNGGRARQMNHPDGYVFDMGPSWYWMPDVFERYFERFGKKVADLYELKKLDPGFEVIFKNKEKLSIPADFNELVKLVESIEKGSGEKLIRFMQEAEYKYNTGINDLVYKPGLSLMEFADWNLMKGMVRLQVFSSFSKHVRKYFTNEKLIALMEFPVLFLGAMPSETPALYSLMNYAGLKQGTFYPMGGFGKVIEAMVNLAIEKGVKIHTNSPVEKIVVVENEAIGINVNGEFISCDGIISSADYHHTESKLLEKKYRNYNEEYWDKKTFAPSSLIYYLGVNKRLPNLEHHNLFFDEDLDPHALEIYKNPSWPKKPLFYCCVPSKTDKVAPEGHENLFLLMPIAPGLNDSEELREKYFQIMIERVEKQIGEKFSENIHYKKSYCVNDFISDYHSYKGNAYGLANTLKQTAILKPKIRNKKVKNLFYTGQLTVPGPGVPPSLISGQVAAELLKQTFSKNKKYESVI